MWHLPKTPARHTFSPSIITPNNLLDVLLDTLCLFNSRVLIHLCYNAVNTAHSGCCIQVWNLKAAPNEYVILIISLAGIAVVVKPCLLTGINDTILQKYRSPSEGIVMKGPDSRKQKTYQQLTGFIVMTFQDKTFCNMQQQTTTDASWLISLLSLWCLRVLSFCLMQYNVKAKLQVQHEGI